MLDLETFPKATISLSTTLFSFCPSVFVCCTAFLPISHAAGAGIITDMLRHCRFSPKSLQRSPRNLLPPPSCSHTASAQGSRRLQVVEHSLTRHLKHSCLARNLFCGMIGRCLSYARSRWLLSMCTITERSHDASKQKKKVAQNSSTSENTSPSFDSRLV